MFPDTLTKRAAALIDICRRKKLMLATAESCTGGLIAGALTEIAGSSAVVERGFVTFNNLGSQDLAHVRVGRFDPSAWYSYSTIRQQLNDVGEHLSSNGCGAGAFSPCTINRFGLTPSAFAAKFYGLYQRDGTYISPLASSLFNSGAETGIDVHGRPIGDFFFYQIGVLNGANEGFGDSNKGKDLYGMVRFDYAKSQYFAANVSGFAYMGNSNAKVQSQQDVNWNRFGVSARVTYKMVDVYAAYAVDRINKLPSSVQGNFDATATGAVLAEGLKGKIRLTLAPFRASASASTR